MGGAGGEMPRIAPRRASANTRDRQAWKRGHATNAHHDVVVFTLPTVPGGRDWLRLLDTNLPDQDEDMEDALPFKFGHPYEVTGRSLLLFLLRPSKGQPTR